MIGLRERTRVAVRAQLAETAMKLFVEQGFEATTVDQIAEATGLSRRSFHRYFAGKEDALAEWLGGIGQEIASALTARPSDEVPWIALRRSFDRALDGMQASSDAPVITRMMMSSPALHGYHLQKLARWRSLLADVLMERACRGSASLSPVAAAALAGAALACLESGQMEWISVGNTASLRQLVDEAMNAVTLAVPLDRVVSPDA